MSTIKQEKQVRRDLATELPHPDSIRTFVVKIVAAQGNNLHTVKLPDGSPLLCMMPTKFRKRVWVKRGDFVIVQRLEDAEKLDLRVQGEITHILHKEQIKELKEAKVWPSEFDAKAEQKRSMLPSSESDESDSDVDEGEERRTKKQSHNRHNPNYARRAFESESESEEEEDNDDDDEEEEEEEEEQEKKEKKEDK